jgi:hypothetical protein
MKPLALQRKCVIPMPLHDNRAYWFIPFSIAHASLKEEAVSLSKVTGKEFALHDGIKVVGYVAYGHYFNLRKYYG